MIQNFPNYFTPPITTGIVSPTGAGNIVDAAHAANATVQSGFTSGQGWSSINSSLVSQGVYLSAPPAIGAYFPGTFKVPEYLEYSLQFQRQLGRADAFTITYAGNYGYNEVIVNPLLNPSSGTFNPNDGAWETAGAPIISGIGYAPVNQNYGKVTAFTNNAHSNYNGLQLNYKHNGHGLTGQVSYTWSHSLDTVSNGGTGLPWNAGAVTTQITPNLSTYNLNYSNADYDIRHNVTGDFVYEEPFKTKYGIVNQFVGGWVLGGKTYFRTGEPFSMLTSQSGSYTQLGTMSVQTVGAGSLRNTAASNPHSCVMNGDCFDSTQYVPVGSQTTFGNVRRNAFFGPHYVNTDLSLLKNIVKRESMTFSIGANAYNIFNHANFSNPGSTLGSSTYGYISSVNAPPTSPYGSFQSAAVTQRVLQVHGKFTF